MRHKYQRDWLRDRNYHVDGISASIAVAVAVVAWLSLDSMTPFKILPLATFLWLGANIFVNIYLADLDSWAEWEIESTNEGLVFFHKNTETSIKFGEIVSFQVSKNADKIVGVLIILRNGQRIPLRWFSDIDKLVNKIEKNVAIDA